MQHAVRCWPIEPPGHPATAARSLRRPRFARMHPGEVLVDAKDLKQGHRAGRQARRKEKRRRAPYQRGPTEGNSAKPSARIIIISWWTSIAWPSRIRSARSRTARQMFSRDHNAAPNRPPALKRRRDTSRSDERASRTFRGGPQRARDVLDWIDRRSSRRQERSRESPAHHSADRESGVWLGGYRSRSCGRPALRRTCHGRR